MNMILPETRRAKMTRDAMRPAGSLEADAATSTLSDGPKLSGVCGSGEAGSCKTDVVNLCCASESRCKMTFCSPIVPSTPTRTHCPSLCSRGSCRRSRWRRFRSPSSSSSFPFLRHFAVPLAQQTASPPFNLRIFGEK